MKIFWIDLVLAVCLQADSFTTEIPPGHKKYLLTPQIYEGLDLIVKLKIADKNEQPFSE